MHIFWEGSFQGARDIDRANRSLTRVAFQFGHKILPRAVDKIGPGNQRELNGIPFVDHYEPADCHVRHGWIPTWGNQVGPLILFQPLEYRTVATPWVSPLKYRTDRLIVPSDDDRQVVMKQGISSDRVFVIPFGIDPDIFYCSNDRLVIPGLRNRVFLWTGELAYRDGLDIALKAFLAAFRRKDDVSLIVYQLRFNGTFGDDLPTDLIDALHQSSSPHVLVITEPLADEALARLYRTASILLAPTRGAAGQLQILEAIACGVPAIIPECASNIEVGAFYIGGKRRSVKPSWSEIPGWEFSVHMDNLVALLRSTYLEEQVVREKGVLGANNVHKSHTWENRWEHWEKVLQCGEATTFQRRLRGDSANNTIIWKGPLRNGSGYAAEGRVLLEYLSQRINVRVIDESSETGSIGCSSKELREISQWEKTSVASNDLMIHNIIGAPRRDGVDLIRTMFETDGLPREWIPLLQKMDAVIVASDFNRETFSDNGISNEKIFVVPGPILTDDYRPLPFSNGSRQRINFVSVFDWSQRKGWDLLVKAWMVAFSANDPVALIIKTTTIVDPNCSPEREIANFISQNIPTCGNPAPIRVINETWSGNRKLIDLYQAADVFVLPTRGEGFGRPILEAMACGLPAIATNWSAPSGYLTEKNSLPLRIKGLVMASQNEKLAGGGRWAEPDLDHLIHLLRCVLEDFGRVQELGIAARETVLQYHPARVSADFINILKFYGINPKKLTIEGV